jgi:hypothetical protein
MKNILLSDDDLRAVDIALSVRIKQCLDGMRLDQPNFDHWQREFDRADNARLKIYSARAK